MKKITTIILLFFAVVATASSQQAPTDNVVAYYPFMGNACDVANGKDALPGAALTSDRMAQSNSAYYFNGSSNKIYLPTNLLPGNTAFCVSVWFKTLGRRPVQECVANAFLL